MALASDCLLFHGVIAIVAHWLKPCHGGALTPATLTPRDTTSISWIVKHVTLGLLAMGLLAGCSDLKVPEDPKPPIPFQRIFRTPKEIWQEYEAKPGLTDWQKKETKVRIWGSTVAIYDEDPKQDMVVALSCGDGKHYVFVTMPESWRSSESKSQLKKATMVEGVFDKAVTDAKSGKQALNFVGTGTIFNN